MSHVHGVGMWEYSQTPTSELDALERQQELIDRGALASVGLIALSGLVKVVWMVFA